MASSFKDPDRIGEDGGRWDSNQFNVPAEKRRKDRFVRFDE